MNSRRREQALFGPLPGYKKGPLIIRSAGLYFCLRRKPVCQGSAAPTPLGATLPDSLGGNLLEFLQLRSCDRRASVSSSFPSQASLGGSLLLRCQVALSFGTPATGEKERPAVFPQRAFEFTRQRWEEAVLVPLEATLERNYAEWSSFVVDRTRRHEQAYGGGACLGRPGAGRV